MLVVGILLLILGVVGVIIASFMFGDISVAAFIGALTALLAGIGFIIGNKRCPKP